MLYYCVARPMITKSIRIIETTDTLLDHVYTNDADPQNSGVLIFNVSDHLPVYLFGTKAYPNHHQ